MPASTYPHRVDCLKKAEPLLSPALARAQQVHQDGGSNRPVQWYFDNLLPEENQRDAVIREARIQGEDTFALLEYLGAESAGSLILLPPGDPLPQTQGLRPLQDPEIHHRISRLPGLPLSHGAPKRMSAAGAQDKLLVVLRDGRLYEPEGIEPSTHILKPNHRSEDYPATVVNEYVVMTLAGRLGLHAPTVLRRYTPDPVYIVERFDRRLDSQGVTRRLHIIDGCQLLNKPRGAKYSAMTLHCLVDIIGLCTNKVSTRLRLFQWLLFNLLVGNNDNHLKNLSFLVGHEGLELAPCYDLLSTAVYHTRTVANERADWPAVALTLGLPGCGSYQAITRASLLAAGETLGIPARISARELDRMRRTLPPALDEITAEIEAGNRASRADVRPFLAGELRLINALRHLLMPEMLQRTA